MVAVVVRVVVRVCCGRCVVGGQSQLLVVVAVGEMLGAAGTVGVNGGGWWWWVLGAGCAAVSLARRVVVSPCSCCRRGVVVWACGCLRVPCRRWWVLGVVAAFSSCCRGAVSFV